VISESVADGLLGVAHFKSEALIAERGQVKMIVSVIREGISIAGNLDNCVLKGGRVATDHEKGAMRLVFS